MAFDKKPSSWFNNYDDEADVGGTEGYISFTLPSNKTQEMQEPLAFVYRVIEEIGRAYKAKPAEDLPTRWTYRENISQPNTAEAVTSRTIINGFTLDASLFTSLALPELAGVQLTTPDTEYDGFPYSAFSTSAPSGSSELLTFSSDGGTTFTETAPTNRGSYIARFVVTKDGRAATRTSSFIINKNEASIDIISPNAQVYSPNSTLVIQYSSSSPVNTVISRNNLVASVVSFTANAITLNIQGVGGAIIELKSNETNEQLAAENSVEVTISKATPSISFPATTLVGNQTFPFTTSFIMTPAQYARITFETSNNNVSIARGTAYPPSMIGTTAGVTNVTILYAGDDENEAAEMNFDVTVSGNPLTTGVSIVAADTYASNMLYVETQPTQPQASDAPNTKILLAKTTAEGDPYEQITFPYVFDIFLSPHPNVLPTAVFNPTGGSAYGNFINVETSFGGQGLVRVRVTILQLPTFTGNGNVDTGNIVVTIPAQATTLGWSGEFLISVFKEGPTFRLQESGMRGPITNAAADINGSIVSLNGTSLYNDSWNNDQSHRALIYIYAAGGAPSAGITAVWTGVYAYPDYKFPITFDGGITTKSIAEGVGYFVNISQGGTATLTISSPAGDDDDDETNTRTITFTVLRITPTLNAVQLNPPPCCSSIDSGIATVTINNYGSGYSFTTAPIVTVGAPTSPSGTQAIVTATVSGGAITAIAVGAPGSGYTTAPDVTITAVGSSGSGATAFASLLPAPVTVTYAVSVGYDYELYRYRFYINNELAPDLNLLRGYVYVFTQEHYNNTSHRIAFKNGETPYTTGVVDTGTPGTAGAKTVLTVASDAPSDLRYYCTSHGNGMGSGITVTGTTPPPDEVNSFTVTNQGTGYTTTPTITLSGGGGTGASAGTVTRTPARISALTIVNAGSGYYSPPLITIAPPPV